MSQGEPDTMSVKEAAAELNIHPITVHKWIKQGRLEREPAHPYKRRQPVRVIRASVERVKRGE